MTLRQSKHSDQKKLQETMKNKQRIVEEKSKLPPYTLIICEGEKTEPNYVMGLIRVLKSKYPELRKDTRDRIKVIGTGRNTRGLLKYARKYALQPENRNYERVWLMYDKDDFPYDDFDNTHFSIENDEKFFAAWSNECIELWFILYFQDLKANLSRNKYKRILKKHFDYKKNLKDIYDNLENLGDVDKAIERAKKLLSDYTDESPSKMAPATLVYKLIEELRSYF